MGSTRGKKPSVTKNGGAERSGRRSYCGLPVMPPRVFPTTVSAKRVAAIFAIGTKWMNGTVLHYHFFKKPGWRGTAAEENVVREAFQEWKDLGIGLDFKETAKPSEAEIRIGFQRGDGSWSYVGRDVLTIPVSERTMNFGWNVAHDRDTVLHEIGHTLGMHHEHQNSQAGIVWDEERVYEVLGGDPNFWSREQTFYNILRKISPSEVTGSKWDPNSIMHYQFDAGLILAPPEYQDGVWPVGGLSAEDKLWARHTYPAFDTKKLAVLEPLHSHRLAIAPGEQRDFLLKPDSTRQYTIQTFGESDTVMVVFEDVDGTPRYLAGEDDTGTEANARLEVRLRPERRYTLRIRLAYEDVSGSTAVMMW